MTAKMVLISYLTDRATADANQELIERVFDELEVTDPGCLRYMSFRLADGVGFVHIGIFNEDWQLNQLKSFSEFQAGINDRAVTPPTRTEVTLIGSYGFGELGAHRFEE
jgi:hypothetical protein